jgi:hypothetical protein
MRQWIGFLVVSAITCATSTPLAAEQRARTEDGKEIILRDDGTWIYAPEPKDDKGPAPRYKKDPRAVQQYKGRRGTFALWLVPETWKQSEKPSNEVAEVEFKNKDGDGYGMIIAERLVIPLETLKKVAIENIRKVDKDAAILEEEKRVVNGTEVLSMVINMKPEGIGVTMYSYYYVGKEGAIQVVTWAGQNLFQELRPELEAFLNGFEIIKEEKSR